MKREAREWDYRLKIIKSRLGGGDTYLYRLGRKVFYVSGDETSLALSNLVSDRAVEVRFKLMDAESGEEAARLLTEVLQADWANNLGMCPQVEVL